MSGVECRKRVIKERARVLVSNFPFKKIPGRIIIELIRFVGICINKSPEYNGLLDVYPPQNIIMGQDLAYYKNFNYIFRSYDS